MCWTDKITQRKAAYVWQRVPQTITQKFALNCKREKKRVEVLSLANAIACICLWHTHTPTRAIRQQLSGHIAPPLFRPPRPSHSTTFGTCKQFSVIIDNKYNICIALSRVATTHTAVTHSHSLTTRSHTVKEREWERDWTVLFECTVSIKFRCPGLATSAGNCATDACLSLWEVNGIDRERELEWEGQGGVPSFLHYAYAALYFKRMLKFVSKVFSECVCMYYVNVCVCVCLLNLLHAFR